MNWIHRELEALALRTRVAFGATIQGAVDERAKEEGLALALRSNVDLWFAPTSDRERQARREVARKVLAAITDQGYEALLVYLPNLAARDAYVDLTYPGARTAAMRDFRRLADEFEIPLLDLSNTVRGAGFFSDYHHLNPNGQKLMNEIIARRLAELRGE